MFQGVAIDSIKDNIEKMKSKRHGSVTACDDTTVILAHSVHNYICIVLFILSLLVFPDKLSRFLIIFKSPEKITWIKGVFNASFYMKIGFIFTCCCAKQYWFSVIAFLIGPITMGKVYAVHQNMNYQPFHNLNPSSFWVFYEYLSTFSPLIVSFGPSCWLWRIKKDCGLGIVSVQQNSPSCTIFWGLFLTHPTPEHWVHATVIIIYDVVIVGCATKQHSAFEIVPKRRIPHLIKTQPDSGCIKNCWDSNFKKIPETTAWTLLYVSYKTFFHKDCALTLTPDCRVWEVGVGGV